MGVYEFGYNYNGNGGLLEVCFYNFSLKWEKNYVINIGIDFILFNRLIVFVEWYNCEIKDLLMDKLIFVVVGVINSLGVVNMFVNVGLMRNCGFELELKFINI